MSIKIISGSEWLPLQVEEGRSAKLKKEAFVKEIQEFNSKIFFTEFIVKFDENYVSYKFDIYNVYVHISILDKFTEKFRFYIEGNQIKYDNLINICIMVKDASDDFRSVLQDNLPYMDRYTILDTGSTDNTISIIKEVLKNKRGELYQEPFINFRDSRNRLLELAGEACFFNIMLDDTYVLNGDIRQFLDFARGDNIVDSYSLVIDGTDTLYTSNRVTKSSRKLKYENLLHEIIQSVNNINCSVPYKCGFIYDKISGYMNNRTKARKQSDLTILFNMQKEDPTEPRTYYYIADSFLGLKDWSNALEWFMKRVDIGGGFSSEIQDSLYYIAVIKDMYIKHPWEECEDSYLKCYNADPTRSESLYFIGLHYHNIGIYDKAFIYWKKAYELGIPQITMSFRKDIYNFYIPKDFASLCYNMGEYKLGEEAARKTLQYKQDELTDKWLHIFYHINKSNFTNTKIRISNQKTIALLAPGGWTEWDGESLRITGLGGAETSIIKYAEKMAQLGYKVIVFCKCTTERTYEGVLYLKDSTFSTYISNYIIDICIINRYPEYIPVSCLQNIKTYYLMHDLSSPNEIITLHNNLAGILCISDWHKQYFLLGFPTCANRTEVISYGIETSEFDTNSIKEKYNFIYPSFPNRGLLQLLKMWPRIIEKYPDARLNIFCDTQHSWTQEHWKNEVTQVESMIEKYKDTVTNHGWVNGKTLRQFWNKAHVWLYPCTFQETCCLTAWEAAASKTLVVSTNLAALNTSVGDRGIVIDGDATNIDWQNKTLSQLFQVLDNNLEHQYTDRNFTWVKTKNFDTVVNNFVNRYI